MVTHAWGNLFSTLVAAVVADALGDADYCLAGYLLQTDIAALRQMLFRKGTLSRTYWICAFSVDQHGGICAANPGGDRDPVTGVLHPVCDCGKPKYFNTTDPVYEGRSILCEMNKFTDMMTYLAASGPDFQQVVVVDPGFELFSRAWCIAEIAQARAAGMAQSLKLSAKQDIAAHADRLKDLRVQDMKASRPEDVDEILDSISDHDEFNARLHDMIFDKDSGLLSAWMCAQQRMEHAGRLAAMYFSERSPSLRAFFACQKQELV